MLPRDKVGCRGGLWFQDTINRELVDSLCRDGTDMTHPLTHIGVFEKVRNSVGFQGEDFACGVSLGSWDLATRNETNNTLTNKETYLNRDIPTYKQYINYDKIIHMTLFTQTRHGLTHTPQTHTFGWIVMEMVVGRCQVERVRG